MAKGWKIPYLAEELEFLKRHQTMPRRELTVLFNKKFNRELSYKNLSAKCKRMGLKTGRTGRFEKGHTPWTKGKKGIFNSENIGKHPNSKKHHFKKGQTPPNVHYIGHERITKDGYIEISVAETNPHTGHSRRYKLKHRHIWEQANGTIPKGNIIKFIDGDKTNCALDNLIMITMAENIVINRQGLSIATGDVLTSAIAFARLKLAASKTKK